MEGKFVSVLIPTYRDWERLSLCVKALAHQSYTQELFEVIIINNDPTDPAPANFVLPDNFKIITEAKPGSYAARNAGLKMAKGEIIAFTDADCIPSPDWIQNAVYYLNNNRFCSRIAGYIEIFYNNPKPTTAEYYNSIFAFPQKSHATYSGTSVTGNMITYKNVFDAVGVFDDTLLSLGDLEWGKRAHKAGFQIQYVENVRVKHPARTLKELIKKEKRVGGGQGSMGRSSTVRNLINYLADNRPRLYIIKHIYRYSKGIGLLDKVKVLLLRHYLLYIRATEKLRVQSGKQPERA